ncbi:uncharacterized protein LOC122133268 isoform X2 [Clupea harengus]|uniref:Uncharacterized protein LOC122133268 isoform X2 n=1 Tax=Clupea harengus TaxID=7950 RepID=A0A8M1KRG8_CLUHA|nr:uncharacterized protein LOC122133268 isoform X2 [Clupea harengus]
MCVMLSRGEKRTKYMSIRIIMQKAEFECSTESSSAKALKLRELSQHRETQLALTALTLSFHPVTFRLQARGLARDQGTFK